MGFISDNVTLDDPAFIHESAWLYGKVYVGPGASIWPNVVTRAEFLEIRIGARTNIQDFVMIHVGAMTPTIVGEDCSITHHVILHGCDIGDRCLIGINATIMDGAKIGANSIVAGTVSCVKTASFPRIHYCRGAGKVVGTRDNGTANTINAAMYQRFAAAYAEGRDRLEDSEIAEVMALYRQDG